MNLRSTVVFVVACASVMTVVAQQKRPYDVVMKDVNATFANLKKNLDANSLASAVEDAGKLQSLFKETEVFWSAFKTKDAIEYSKSGQTEALAVANAAQAGNAQKAQGAYGSIGKSCKGCHDSHRELMPDKSFKIKP
jgi:cytochrome c556